MEPHEGSTASRLLEPARPGNREASHELELRLLRNIHRLEIVCDMADRLLAGQDPEQDVLPAIFAEANAMLGIDGVYHFRYSDSGAGLELTFAGRNGDGNRSLSRSVEEAVGDLAELVTVRRKPAHHTLIHLSDDPRVGGMKRFGARCCACQPIAMGRRFYGVLCFESRCHDKFASRDLRLFATIAQMLALAWDRSEKLFELNECNRELQHRVNNVLSNVQAIAFLSRQSSHDVDQFVAKLSQRLLALARTNNILTGGAPRIPLRDLLKGELEPYESKGRISLGGRNISIPSHRAAFLGMVIHELTSNAVLHGALSTEHGTLGVHWALDRRIHQRLLVIRWSELGGPPPTADVKGFGSRLFDTAPLSHILIDRQIRPDGMQVTITVRLD